MRIKPSIFIGSSTEFAQVADQLAEALRTKLNVSVTVWNDPQGVFRLGRNTMESILTVPHFFDYSILVLGPDDKIVSRGKGQMSPRDNTIFELGVFLGSQGRKRAFAVVLEPFAPKDKKQPAKKRLKIPSDYAGEQFIPVKLTRSKAALAGSIQLAVARLSLALDEHQNLSFLTPLPSTILAVTYYRNFLNPMCDKLLKGSLHIADSGTTIQPGKEGFSVTVAIPKSLDRASRSGQDLYKFKNRLSLCTVEAETRPFPFFVSMKKGRGGYQFFDVPTTLRGCSEAIRLLLPAEAAGKSKEQELVERREVENFAETLQHVIDTDPDGQHLKDRFVLKFW